MGSHASALPACGSLPDGQEDRCVLLPANGEHWLSPFDDAESGTFTYRAPHSPSKMKMPKTRRNSIFRGREVRCERLSVFWVLCLVSVLALFPTQLQIVFQAPSLEVQLASTTGEKCEACSLPLRYERLHWTVVVCLRRG